MSAAPKRSRHRTDPSAYGEPMVWLTGGSLALALFMIAGLLALVFYQGAAAFWPAPLVVYEDASGRKIMGEISRREKFHEIDPETEAAGEIRGHDKWRTLVRTGNFDITGNHFEWIDDTAIAKRETPEWGLVVERLAWGRFYGFPVALVLDGTDAETDPARIWSEFQKRHGAARERHEQIEEIEREDIGRVNRRIEQARLDARKAELRHGAGSPEALRIHAEAERAETDAETEFAALRARIAAIEETNAREQLRMRAIGGEEKTMTLAEIVRAYPANQLSTAQKWGVYLSRWGEFLADDPREANSEGGIFPAIFGTVALTLIMSLMVVPFGAMAALYLHEYAGRGPLVSVIRIAINNLAGVPSIVFGVFGLGFFCYIMGAGIDQALFAERLPNPTYGKGGLIWAALTLALLTAPVVIVATEEALAAVPNSMREGSFACGASKWQTIRRIILPASMPGIITGMILAMARGAGEVAPLMLVGAVKLAPELPVDGVFPYVHPQRSFMHLGFHIFDLGFQSQNSEAARPMVYATTGLLILLVTVLNLLGSRIRAALRKRAALGKF